MILGFEVDHVSVKFVLVGNGELCSESGFQIINDLNTCKSAAKIYGKAFGEYETADNYPKGCYIERNDHVYFNNHEIGRNISFATPICYRKGR